MIGQIILLTALLLLLGVSVGSRFREELEREFYRWKESRRFRASWHPTFFDGSRLARQVEEVRRDPVAYLHSRHGSLAHRAERLAATRETISRLPFFTELEARNEAAEAEQPVSAR